MTSARVRGSDRSGLWARADRRQTSVILGAVAILSWMTPIPYGLPYVCVLGAALGLPRLHPAVRAAAIVLSSFAVAFGVGALITS